MEFFVATQFNLRTLLAGMYFVTIDVQMFQ
jgi:hypothetical protein